MNHHRKTPTAEQIAAVLLQLSEVDSDLDQEPMTNMRLQKLLYYVQGWSMAIRGEPAFSEAIEAWEHGPVVPTLYQKLKDLKRSPVPASRLRGAAVDPELHAFIASVWEDLREHSAIELRHMTHRQAPWRDAWKGRHLPNHGNEEISKEALRAFFGAGEERTSPKFKIRKPPSAWFDEESPFARGDAG